MEKKKGCIAAFWLVYNFDHVAPTPRKSINGIASEGGGLLIRTWSLWFSAAAATDDSETSLPNVVAAVVEIFDVKL